MFLKELFERFLKEKPLLTGVSPENIRSCQQALNARLSLFYSGIVFREKVIQNT